MPTRILREGIITSPKVNSLSETSEVFYRRLMSVADDYGRYFAHPSLLRAALYPLQLDRVREASMERCLKECQTASLVRLYSVKGTGYLEIADFRQQTRGPSKFPDPSTEVLENHLLSKCEANAKQLYTQSESESESDAKTKAGPPVAQVQQALNISAAANSLSDKAVGIYEAYPRKVSKPEALKAILKCFKKVEPERLLELTKQYAGIVADWPESERQYVPYPTTWFNQERFSDDPKTWLRGDPVAQNRIPPHRGGNL
jgi:hypothetical protein